MNEQVTSNLSPSDRKECTERPSDSARAHKLFVLIQALQLAQACIPPYIITSHKQSSQTPISELEVADERQRGTQDAMLAKQIAFSQVCECFWDIVTRCIAEVRRLTCSVEKSC